MPIKPDQGCEAYLIGKTGLESAFSNTAAPALIA